MDEAEMIVMRLNEKIQNLIGEIKLLEKENKELEDTIKLLDSRIFKMKSDIKELEIKEDGEDR